MVQRQLGALEDALAGLHQRAVQIEENVGIHHGKYLLAWGVLSLDLYHACLAFVKRRVAKFRQNFPQRQDKGPGRWYNGEKRWGGQPL